MSRSKPALQKTKKTKGGKSQWKPPFRRPYYPPPRYMENYVAADGQTDELWALLEDIRKYEAEQAAQQGAKLHKIKCDLLFELRKRLSRHGGGRWKKELAVRHWPKSTVTLWLTDYARNKGRPKSKITPEERKELRRQEAEYRAKQGTGAALCEMLDRKLDANQLDENLELIQFALSRPKDIGPARVRSLAFALQHTAKLVAEAQALVPTHLRRKAGGPKAGPTRD